MSQPQACKCATQAIERSHDRLAPLVCSGAPMLQQPQAPSKRQQRRKELVTQISQRRRIGTVDLQGGRRSFIP